MHIAKYKQTEDEEDRALPEEAAAAISDGDLE